MSKIMQNLVVLMEPSEDAYCISLKSGNMILNRFCIDEDAAFELSGVSYLESSGKITYENSREFDLRRKEKGKENSFLRFNFKSFDKLTKALTNFHIICMNK